MPALPDDIIRATRAARVVVWTGDTREGRDGLRNIEPGSFENGADAQTVLANKAELIAIPRRRFVVDVEGEVVIDPTDSIPSFRVIDEEVDADTPAVLTRFEYDMETEMTGLEVLG